MAAPDALKICEHFESILKGTFGPNGLDVMLKSSSGNILITNSGATILGSLSVGHPIGRMVVDSIRSLCDTTGSGATYFTLVLTQLFREITKITSQKETHGLHETSTETRVQLTALSDAFAKLEGSLFDEVIMPVLDKLAVCVDIQNEDTTIIKEKLSNVIETSLNGRFPLKIKTLFTKLLVDFLFSSCQSIDEMYQMVLDAIDGFPEICVECHGVPQDKSHVIKGFMIPRQFATSTKEPCLQESQSGFKFVVLTFSLEETTTSNKTMFAITDAELFDEALNWKRVNALRMITFLKQQQIQLILSTASLPDMMIHLCNQLGIAAIAMIPTEVINHLCKFAGIEPLPDLNLDQPAIPDIYLGRGQSCVDKIVGTQKFSHLVLDDSVIQHIYSYQIMLCAPTQGLCQQYYLALLEALKTVRFSFGNNKHELLFLPSCGLVEIALSLELCNYSDITGDMNLSSSCEILGKSLLQIPKILSSNSYAAASGGKHFLRCLQRIESGWKNGYPLEGIEGRTGQIVDPYSKGLLEPLLGRKCVFRHLLQCVSQLLRVDRIVGVSQIPSKQGTGYNSESSDSD